MSCFLWGGERGSFSVWNQKDGKENMWSGKLSTRVQADSPAPWGRVLRGLNVASQSHSQMSDLFELSWTG